MIDRRYLIGAAVVVAIVVGLAVLVPRLTGSPSAAGSQSAPPSGQAPPNCLGGNQRTAPQTQGKFETTDLAIRFPSSWNRQLPTGNWPWLNDLAARGRANDEATAGVVVGGLTAAAGFSADPRKAVDQVIGCMLAAGQFADSPETAEKASRGTTIGGHRGWRRDLDITVYNDLGPRTYQVTVAVLDIGVRDQLATVIGFGDDKALMAEATRTIDRIE